MELDAQSISTIAAPVGTGTILWFFIKSWIASTKKEIQEAKASADMALKEIEAQEDSLHHRLDEIKTMITSIRLELADAGIKRTSDDVEKLKEKSFRMEGQILAAWKALDKVGVREKRLSDTET